MKAWEAFKYLEEGKKVREKSWDADEYIVLECGVLKDTHGGNQKFYNVWLNRDWELYTETPKPMTFMEALEENDAGKMVHRRDGQSGDYGPKEMRFFGHSVKDIEATDWEVVE